jgi:hypothetical protein
LPSFARGAFPAGVAGKIIRGTGFNNAAAWDTSAAAMFAGATNYLFSWNTITSDWRVFATA